MLEKLAYIAGFVDGEGCFGIGKQPKSENYSVAVLTIVQNDIKPLEFNQTIYGGRICKH